MARGGWQVQQRKARQAAKASRISAPITISLPPTATTRSTTGYPDIIPFASTISASDPVRLAFLTDCSPSATPETVAPAAATTTTTARPLTPKALGSTLTDGHSPPKIVAAAISSAPVNPAVSIQPSPTAATPFDAGLSTQADRSVLQHPVSARKPNKKARRKLAEAAAAAAAASESGLAGELSEASGDPILAQSVSSPPTTAATAECFGAEMRRLFLDFPDRDIYESDKGQEVLQQQEEDLETMTAKGGFQQADATAECLGAEMRRLFLDFPEGEIYESDKGQEVQQQQEEDLEAMTAKEGFQQVDVTAECLGAEMRRLFLDFPEGEIYESDKEQEVQQQQEEDLETMTAKITALWQALQNDSKGLWQKDDGLQPRQDQRENELQVALVQAELRIADLQSHTAQAHEDLFSFFTNKLVKQEEASRNASHAAARIMALLIFCNCALLGLLIAPYL